MVLTKKFSEFTADSYANGSTEVVGLTAGDNIRTVRYPTWLTVDRPAAPFNGLLGYNLSLKQYEFYDAATLLWTQLEDSTDIATLLALLASHVVAEGASLIGLENQGAVTNKTVQDFAEATFIAQTDNGTLVNGQFLALLSSGMVSVATTTGVLSSRIHTGTTNQINISNGDGAGNPTYTLSSTVNLPGTFNIQTSTAMNAILDEDNMVSNSATALVTQQSLKTYVDTTVGVASPLTTKGDLYGFTTIPARLPVGTVDGQLAQVSAAAATGLAWSTATYPATTTINQILFSSAANVIAGLASANSSVLVTSAAGVPSIGTDLPTAITIGAAYIYRVGGTDVAMLDGGTNASLVADNGAMVYSDATGLALLASTVTAGQIVRSGSSAAPTWSTATYPATTTINQILFSSAANVIAGLASANSAMLYTNSTGVPALSASMTDGQIMIGSTGASPTPATITAGAGVSILNAAGSITISSGGGGFSWTEVTGTTQAIAVNNGYVANNVALVTLTLPATAAIGDSFTVVGKGAGLFKIAQNAGQTINVVGSSTTTGAGGSLTAVERYDAIEIVCITANTDWVVTDFTGNFTIV